jgi:hypothetical protein
MTKSNEPKILLLDCESGGVNALKSDLGFLLCFGYKWLGEKTTKVLTVDEFPGWFSTSKGINDKPLLKAALKIMEEADILVGHFSSVFDRRFIQGRCAIHGLTPPPATRMRDTCMLARSAFNYSSNRLENLANVLKLPVKKYHKECPDEWPGWWFRAMSGDKSAIHAMARYCAQDIETLEHLYLALRRYDNASPRLYEDRETCSVCGSGVQYRGIAIVGQHRYRRYQCTRPSCGRWDRERKALKDIIDSSEE